MNRISAILGTGDSIKKINVLEELATADNPEMIACVIDRLDDADIRVRGEAFSSLILNENRITAQLISNLDSSNSNIRGFVSLVLANRNEVEAIPALVRLMDDEHPMVRSCAAGALGYLRARDKNTLDALLGALLDSNLEVRKSAAHAIAVTGVGVPRDLIKSIYANWAGDMQDDPDLELLFDRMKQA